MNAFNQYYLLIQILTIVEFFAKLLHVLYTGSILSLTKSLISRRFDKKLTSFSIILPSIILDIWAILKHYKTIL